MRPHGYADPSLFVGSGPWTLGPLIAPQSGWSWSFNCSTHARSSWQTASCRLWTSTRVAPTSSHYQAAHLGLEAACIHDEDGSLVPIATLFDDVWETIAEIAEELELLRQLERLRRRVEEGVGYVRQRRVWRETQSMQEVVTTLRDELALEASSTRLDRSRHEVS